MLQEIYQDEKQPVLLFGKDFRLIWLNSAAIDQFPSLLEEMDLREFFPDAAFSGLANLPRAAFPVKLSAGEGQYLSVSVYEDEELLYAAAWTDQIVCRIFPNDDSSAPGIRLMDAWIRQSVFQIFNHLDLLEAFLERARLSEGSDSVERIERTCRQLLRLGIDLNGYYNEDHESFLPEDTVMKDFLEELFRQADFRLDGLGISLNRKYTCGGAVCRIDKKKFTAAVLNLIDLSASYAKPGDSMEVELDCQENEFCLKFTDGHTPDSVTKGGLDCIAVVSPREQRDQRLPKISLGFLDKAVRECGGRCILNENQHGLRLFIRIPLSDSPIPAEVRDETSYLAHCRGENRTSLVSILLSDLEQ